MNIIDGNAAQSDFYRANDRTEPALPEWSDLTVEERDEERARGEDSPYFYDFTGHCLEGCDRPQVIFEDGTAGCGHEGRTLRELGLA